MAKNKNNNNTNYAIEMLNISKSFLNGKIIANDNISLKVKENEIHALIGENGAGKSTLMSILFGIYSPDSGKIKINGKNVYFSSAKDASAAGLGMVHQHFKLVPTYTIYENIILGCEDTNKYGILKSEQSRKKINDLIKKYNFNLNIDEKVSNLTVGQEQKTEILKLLYRDSNILIFDEPTAVLSPDEIDSFLKMILDLKKDGKTIIIITHKFSEIKSVADRATIIRLGKYIDDFDVKSKSIEQMAKLMVGKDVNIIKNNIKKEFGKEILDVKNLIINKNNNSFKTIDILLNPELVKLKKLFKKEISLNKENILNNSEELKQSLKNIKELISIQKQNHKEKINNKISLLMQKKNEHNELKINNKISKLNDYLNKFENIFDENILDNSINFKIRSGEIYAVAGVEGNGQSELALIISGLLKNDYAIIHLEDENISNLSINERYIHGISHIPEDRHKHGLILDESIYMNIASNKIDKKPYSKNGFINQYNIREKAIELIKAYDVRGTVRGTEIARLLSGGNQQKLIIAREINNDHKLLILVQPTRGLDLGAIEYIHSMILEEKQKGNAILLISYELDEILSLADTISVMYKGKFIGTGNIKEMTRNKIGQLMAGDQ